MSVFTLAQTKGGAGKTTLATSLVCEFAHRGYKTAALDLDPNRGLYDFIARVPELNNVTNVLPEDKRRNPDQTTGKIILGLAKTHDAVVVDLMGAETNDMSVAMGLADMVLIPSQTSFNDITCGRRTWALASGAEMTVRRDIKMAVLLTRTAAGAAVPRLEEEVRAAYAEVGVKVMRASFQDRLPWRSMTYSQEQSVFIPHLHAREENAARNFLGVFDEMLDLLAGREPGTANQNTANAAA